MLCEKELCLGPLFRQRTDLCEDGCNNLGACGAHSRAAKCVALKIAADGQVFGRCLLSFVPVIHHCIQHWHSIKMGAAGEEGDSECRSGRGRKHSMCSIVKHAQSLPTQHQDCPTQHQFNVCWRCTGVCVYAPTPSSASMSATLLDPYGNMRSMPHGLGHLLLTWMLSQPLA